ncbi:MAG: ABC-2 type transporter [candidate division BRC1 bacterium ADurb.BinA364]|nr:MAG: ABC-2 type transporter [candidate division BRC1 bacterium ADurb.BinA364]
MIPHFFRSCWAFLARDATSAVSYKLNFAMQLGMLLFSLVPLYFFSRLIGNHPAIDPYGGYMPFVVLGMIVNSMMYTAFSTLASAIRQEQTLGTLEAIFMTPTRMAAILIGSSLWPFFWASLQAAIMLASAMLLFDFAIFWNILPSLALLALLVLSASCIGVFSASLIMVFKQGNPIKIVMSLGSYLLGGVVFPVSEFPGWLQKVAALIPITHGLQGIRENLLKSGGWTEVAPQLLALAIFFAILFPLSLVSFSKALNIVRREGSLVHY